MTAFEAVRREDTMRNDIVCGREIPDRTPFHSDYGDRPYYFHSHACLMNFAENPLRYVDKSKSVSSTEGSPKQQADGEYSPSRV